MRTAIFVYEPTTVDIITNESGLVLCKMGATTLTSLNASNTLPVERGIYKIESLQDVVVTCSDGSATTQPISNPKKPMPDLQFMSAYSQFADVTESQIQAFFALDDGKGGIAL